MELPSGRVVYGFSAKDTILNGRFSVNVPSRVLEYRKRLTLPNGTCLAISGGAQYVVVGGGGGQRLSDRVRPFLGAQLLLGGVGNGNM